MGRYLVRRILLFIPVFIGATFLIFALVFLIPGDPIRALAGDRQMSQSTLEALRDRYNLDEPFLKQYGLYVSDIVQGDFGTDFRGREVTEIMSERIPVTFRLAIYAFIFELILGILAGILAGIRKGGFMDNLVLVSTTAVISIPIFVLAFLAQILLGVQWKVFPVAGIRDGNWSYVLPAIVLGSVSLAYIAR